MSISFPFFFFFCLEAASKNSILSLQKNTKDFVVFLYWISYWRLQNIFPKKLFVWYHLGKTSLKKNSIFMRKLVFHECL